jgi:hypothetical protein
MIFWHTHFHITTLQLHFAPLTTCSRLIHRATGEKLALS